MSNKHKIEKDINGWLERYGHKSFDEQLQSLIYFEKENLPFLLFHHQISDQIKAVITKDIMDSPKEYKIKKEKMEEILIKESSLKNLIEYSKKTLPFFSPDNKDQYLNSRMFAKKTFDHLQKKIAADKENKKLFLKEYLDFAIKENNKKESHILYVLDFINKGNLYADIDKNQLKEFINNLQGSKLIHEISSVLNIVNEHDKKEIMSFIEQKNKVEVGLIDYIMLHEMKDKISFNDFSKVKLTKEDDHEVNTPSKLFYLITMREDLPLVKEYIYNNQFSESEIKQFESFLINNLWPKEIQSILDKETVIKHLGISDDVIEQLKQKLKTEEKPTASMRYKP